MSLSTFSLVRTQEEKFSLRSCPYGGYCYLLICLETRASVEEFQAMKLKFWERIRFQISSI